MKRVSRQDLWQRLQSGGLVEGEIPARNSPDSPWYIRVMLGAAGWLGSLFLLGFVGVGFAFVMQSGLAALLVGLAISGGALALFRVKQDNDFLSQFGLAVGLAGQMLLLFGLSELFERQYPLLFFSAFAVELILTLLLPNFIYRVMTSLAAMFALALTCNSIGFYGLAPALNAGVFALIWLMETRWTRFGEICRPVGYGLALALLCYRASLLWGPGGWWFHSRQEPSWLFLVAPWLGRGLLVLVLLAVVLLLLRRLQIPLAGRSGGALLLGTLLVMAAAFQAPGIVPALLVLICGFAVSNRVLIGLGLLALGGFLSSYYYTLQASLLSKSLLLVLLGVMLLLARWLMNRYWPSAPSADTGGAVDA